MNVKTFDKDEKFYDPQNHQLITPEIYFLRNYGVGNNTMIVEEEYSPEVLNFLFSIGELIRFIENVSRKKIDSKIVEDVEDYHAAFLIEHNIVFAKKTESGNYKLTLEYPAGYPCIVEKFDNFLDLNNSGHKVSILIKEYGDVSIQSVPLTFPQNFDLKLNYGLEFANSTHEKIVKKMNNDSAGLFIFNGPPGGGKTYYIKYLTKIVDREFIFIPSNMVDALNSPEFLTLLMRHKNSVLVLEDAEHAIKSRKESPHSALVSVLLNLSEGLLSSVLNVSIVVTHNCHEDLIDGALTRKGRLNFRHTFDKLSKEDSQALLEHLGSDHICDSGMILSDIYNVSDDTGKAPVVKETVKIGFGS